MIPLDDRGLLLGDGLFETILAIDGRLIWADEHLDRLAAGCAALGLPAPDRIEAVRLMKAALADAGLQNARAAVRLTLTAGSGGRGLERPEAPTPRLFASAAPSPAPEGAAAVIWAQTRRNEGSPAARLKTLAYLDNVLARAEALSAGAAEALMSNNRGEAACAAAANLFWIGEGRLFTPALDCGVLAGIARARVIAEARRMGLEVLEVRAGPQAVAAAAEAFLTNSLIGVRPISRIDGRAMEPSALTQALGRALQGG